MLNQPIVFAPIYQERPWGGRALQEHYGRRLRAGAIVGEAWEMVDRPEAQSAACAGAYAEATLHSLWKGHRAAVFGKNAGQSERFPLLIKLLDARETLSVQVHPSGLEAGESGTEPKNEWWYILEAEPGAAVYAGFRKGVDRAALEQALATGEVEALLHRIPVAKGDSIYVPVGRCHAIGAGCLIAEVQQNSDTTYRIFDWNRVGLDGQARPLHISESLACIDFSDHEPSLAPPLQKAAFGCDFFGVEWLDLKESRNVVGETGPLFMVVEGEVQVGAHRAVKGDWFVLPVEAGAVEFVPQTEGAALLRVSLPDCSC